MTVINKKEQKQRLNARMRRLVSPKSPLIVFHELYKGIPIFVEEEPNESVMRYTASFVVSLILNRFRLNFCNLIFSICLCFNSSLNYSLIREVFLFSKL